MSFFSFEKNYVCCFPARFKLEAKKKEKFHLKIKNRKN